MTIRRSISFWIVALMLSAVPTFAQHSAPENKNAALRYWSAFSAMQDSGLSGQQVNELSAILDGSASAIATPWPVIVTNNGKTYPVFKSLVEKNKIPLEIMARATALPECDWGLDPSFGSEEPVEYVRDALTLGHLNVLYAFELMSARDNEAAAKTLAAGLRFSHDVANGGTLLATLVSAELMSEHLRAVALALRRSDVSAEQRAILQKAVTRLGPDGLDWESGIDREFQVMRTHFSGDAQASATVTRIDSAYAKALRDPSALAALQEAIHNAPPAVAQMIPNPARVLKKKQALSALLAQTRSALE